MVKIGILGGTFDPIHKGHLALAQAVKTKLQLSKIIFVPAGMSPHKMGKPLTAAALRVQMLELALADFSEYSISMADINRPPPHYSVEMLPLVQAEYAISPAQSYFIIGADLLPKLPLWHQARKLLKLCRLAVVHRPGVMPDLEEIYLRLPALESRMIWVDMPPIAISSTQIRESLRQGKSIENDVPIAVATYIRQKNLYR